MDQQFNFSEVDPLDQKDILELERRIKGLKAGKEDEERFKLYRLTRGVYGQRQLGVQMFRIKIPFGKITTEQLIRIADVSEQFTNGNLHLTTRQNIQLHYVKLEDSPAIWTSLAEKDITAREACGNTVRNLTGSARAGIDPHEPFDVSPYVQAAFEYFLRNPICQDMGRKIKPAFSSSEQDSAFTYIHDFGFIPRLKIVDGQERRGFKVVIGGGLGAISMIAHTVYEFLEEERIIPFMEAAIRVFDRYGEREKRMKARMKFLIKKLGLSQFLELVEAEKPAIKNQEVWVDRNTVPVGGPAPYREAPTPTPVDKNLYEHWLQTNVFEQKQEGFYAVQVKVRLGNIDAETARKLAALIKDYAADDIRLTVNQGLLFKFVRKEALAHIFNQLQALNLADPGFDSIADITACPGTDTCALGVTNSTGLAKELEQVIRSEYPELINSSEIRIKISGCMNSCGQHMIAHIGFHGSSIKKGPLVIPAMQVVMGGGVDPEGKGFIAEKVIKLPTRLIPDALRTLLDAYELEAAEGQYFNDYFREKGKRYFYDLLKPLAATVADAPELLFRDWGQEQPYVQSIGVGECAGVTLDVVGTILNDAKEKKSLAAEALTAGLFADSIYHSYTAMVIGAKALLLSRDIKCNTHKGILDDFQQYFIDEGLFPFEPSFPDFVTRMKKETPSKDFATAYQYTAEQFVVDVLAFRESELAKAGGADKVVVDNYYKA